MYYAAISGSLVHSDGPDCGCWNLIYGTCLASDGQPMGSGQEMGVHVCISGYLFLFWCERQIFCLDVCVLECVSPLRLSAYVYVCRHKKAKAPSSALSSPTSTPPLSQCLPLSLSAPSCQSFCLRCFVYISVLASQHCAD